MATDKGETELGHSACMSTNRKEFFCNMVQMTRELYKTMLTDTHDQLEERNNAKASRKHGVKAFSCRLCGKILGHARTVPSFRIGTCGSDFKHERSRNDHIWSFGKSQCFPHLLSKALKMSAALQVVLVMKTSLATADNSVL
ncbi:hypothetical protein HAX54_019873 [Datura stramonium]|uniref:Uncharacterized protein n=1 Tax=Datura stramonium TaxID=4076 RepID=A0ABS8S1Z2_DATST|nr:hypothetical protein [Datura stramonium]